MMLQRQRNSDGEVEGDPHDNEPSSSTQQADPARIGTFKLAEYLTWMKRGARIKLMHIEGMHLPLWVEVIDFDGETRLVTYRIMTNEELAAWPDEQRDGWNYR